MLWFGIAVMLALLVIGAPIYMGVLAGVILIALYHMHVDLVIVPVIMFSKINVYPLLAVPFFLAAAYFIAYGGTAKAMLAILNSFMRHIPGGPAYVIIIGCVIFAAMSSSSMASIAGFAPIMLPMMAEMGYDKRFSIGLLVVASTLGPLIPPSIMLIMYGVIAEQSIRDLYMAAFIPGFMIAGLLFLTVFIWSRRGYYQKQPAASWRERWQSIKSGWWVMIMPLVVLLPIYAGWVTPTEAGAVCAAYSFFLGAVVYRDLKLKQMWESLRTTLRICSMVFLIVSAAFLLNWVLTFMGVPFDISEMITDANLNKYVFLLVSIFAYLMMGMFFDPVAILLVSVIILLPTVIDMGIDPINYGIMVTLLVGIAGITPPYGILLFTAVGVLREPYHVIVRGCLIFYPALIIGTVLVAYIPQIAMYLPHTIN